MVNVVLLIRSKRKWKEWRVAILWRYLQSDIFIFGCGAKFTYFWLQKFLANKERCIFINFNTHIVMLISSPNCTIFFFIYIQSLGKFVGMKQQKSKREDGSCFQNNKNLFLVVRNDASYG